MNVVVLLGVGQLPPAEEPEVRFRQVLRPVLTREHRCPGCGQWYETTRTNKVYCRDACRTKAYKSRKILREVAA